MTGWLLETGGVVGHVKFFFQDGGFWTLECWLPFWLAAIRMARHVCGVSLRGSACAAIPEHESGSGTSKHQVRLPDENH